MSEKITVILCMGSSCFTRGNNKTLETVKNFLKDHPKRSLVDFRGQLCSGNCKHGPVMKINGELFEEVNGQIAVELISKYLSESE